MLWQLSPRLESSFAQHPNPNHSLVTPRLPCLAIARITALLLWGITLSAMAVSGYHDSTTAKPTAIVYTQPLWFNITAPASLAASIAFSPAWGGSALPLSNRSDGTVDVSVMLPHVLEDVSACNQPWRQTNEFNQTFAGSWVLMMYSVCSYTNYRFASMSGAAGILVYGCPTTAPFNCDPRLKEAVVYVPLAYDVPVISITNADAEKIINYLQAQKANGPPAKDSVVIRLQSTGPLVPEERAALIAIMQKTTLLGLGGGTIPESLPLWSVARFQDPNLDPCRDRVVGTWCENGRIVYINILYHSWSNADITTLPKEFGVFTELRYLSLEKNNFRGAVPPEWCALTKLKSLMLNTNYGVLSLPSCIGQLQALEELALFANSISTLPSAVGTLKNLKWLELQQNSIVSLPDLSNLPNLQVLNVGDNNIIGSFPKLNQQAPLRELGLASNQFKGTIPSNALSGFAGTLQVLDINNNFFTGNLPPLDGFTVLRILDLSSQRGAPIDPSYVGFTGGMPSGWPALVNLQNLFLQENSLTGPFLVSNMLSMQYLDLSNNQLTSARLSDPTNTDIGLLMYDLTAPTIVSLKLSSNKLTGPLTTGNYMLIESFRELFIDHNQVTSFPQELWLSYLKNVDASHNNLTKPFFVGSPPVDFMMFDIRGNPNYQMNPNLPLPDWMVVGETRVQQKNEPFACAPLSSNTAPFMVFNTDPTFYTYRFCDCQGGMFGKAPLCASVPDSAILNPSRMISSDELGTSFPDLITRTGGLGGDLFTTTNNLNASSSGEYSQAVSDSMYGDTNRLTVGMSTSWVFDLRDLYADNTDIAASQNLVSTEQRGTYQVNDSALASPLWTPVRTITVRLHVNRDTFNAFQDQLSVYEGGSDLLGNRALLLRGTSDLRSVIYSDYASSDEYIAKYNTSISKLGYHTSLIEVRVFSPIATLQFTSRAVSGTHFYATYSYDFDCPDGYFYDTSVSPAHCRVNRILFRVGDGIRSAVYAVAAIAMAFVLINLLLLLIFWHYPVYKAASRVFMLLTLIFLLCMSLGALLYAAVPSAGTTTGAAICNGRAWFSCLPLAGILGVILAKSNRLNSIFGSTTLQVKAMTDGQIARTVLTVCVIQVAMLAIFSGFPLSRAVRTVGKGSLSDELVDQCSQENGFMSWIGAEIAYIACLMLPAAYLGFKTRDLPSQFNESAHIQNAIVLLIFFGVIIVPLDIFIQDNPEAAVLIQGLGQAFLTIILTAIIFMPKAYYLHYAVSKQPARANSEHNGTVLDTAAPNSYTNQATVPPGAKPPSGGSGKAAVAGNAGKPRTPSHTLTPHPYPVTNYPRGSSITSNKDALSTPSITTIKRLSSDTTGVLSKGHSGPSSRPTSPHTVLTTLTRAASDSPTDGAGVIRPLSPGAVDLLSSPRRKIRVHTTGGSALEQLVRDISEATPPPVTDTPSSEAPVTTPAAASSSSMAQQPH